MSVHTELPNLYAQIYGRHSLVTVARPYTTIHRAVSFADDIATSGIPEIDKSHRSVTIALESDEKTFFTTTLKGLD